MEAGYLYYSTHHSPAIQARAQEIVKQRRRALPAAADLAAAGGGCIITENLELKVSESSRDLDLYAWSSGMDVVGTGPALAHSTSISDGSSTSSREREELQTNPYELRHGRRYLRDMPYPLPCDLAEMHRQSLRTILCATVFNRAACAPLLQRSSPFRVLELGCGGAYWTASCHEYLKSMGRIDVSFTGVDMASIAPDLRRQGIDWRFIQHDLRRMPWPFQDGEFDYVMIKDMALVVPLGVPSQRLLEESIRILKGGGALEVWESDHVLRCLLPPQSHPTGMDTDEEDSVRESGTFLIHPGMPFAPTQNKYIQQSNAWIEAAFGKRKLPATPCARIAAMLHQWPDSLTNLGSRRVAVPLKALPWERDQQKNSRSGVAGRSRNPHQASARSGNVSLTPDQAALRYTALMIVLQKCESLEPVLKDVSGKNTEEWATWWANMMAELLGSESAGSGECLEVGAWWATKKTT